ncbi:MAG: phosphate ABC transporter substrate-binding protein [Candidatus Margulisiibacteriota bacterium]
MRKLTTITLVLTLLIALSSITSYGWWWSKKQDGGITIKGSTTVLPIAQATAEAYMNANSDAKISVQGGGSSIGIASIIDGTADIGDASRSAKDKELTLAAANGVNLKAHVIAMDGIGIIVNNANPVNSLTREQVRKIYKGEIRNWKAVGGPDLQIVMINRDSSSGTFETFNLLVMDEQKASPECLTVASNKAVQSGVQQTPGAIGYVGIGYLDGSVKPLIIDGVTVSEKTVITKEYPIARPLFMYTNGEPAGLAAQYISFVKSGAGQKLVKKAGFVPLR